MSKLYQPGRSLILFLLLVAMIVGGGSTPTAVSQEKNVQVEIFVALVGADLQVKPVPKHRLLIKSAHSDARYEGATSFEGRLVLTLSPGDYVLRSEAPVEFENGRYYWEVPLLVGTSALRVELSNDNARREGTSQTVRTSTDEGELFKKSKQSVFTVMAEGGKGSGFLVDPSGLVLTNHHVVARSDFIAVKVDERSKYRAVLLADDSRHDVAVLLVNPAVLTGIAPLPTADPSSSGSRVAVGDRVIAIGSPLTTEGILTTGIVSKVENDAIIADININPGNSGGPLLSLKGEVVGITTFGVQATGGGPGISGIVRVHVATSILGNAREKMKTAAMPSAERLPIPSPTPFPAEALERLANADVDVTDYHIEAGKMDVQLITPVLIASLEKRGAVRAAKQKEKRQRKGKSEDTGTPPGAAAEPPAAEGFYEWRRYAGDYQPIVRIQAIPEVGMTGGSFFAKAMLGAGAPGRYRFKTDFLKMRLLRDGVEVQPVHPGRVRQVVNATSGADVMEDIGTYGSYEYLPDAFEPSKGLVLEVYSEDKPDNPRVCPIEKTLQTTIWQEFAPYFSSLPTEPEGARP